MSWNHRIIAHEHNEEVVLQIHEVYYGSDGIPSVYTTRPVPVSSEDIKGIRWTLNKMKLALKKPILSAAHWPDEYHEK
jgi:hypothetical protein